MSCWRAGNDATKWKPPCSAPEPKTDTTIDTQRSDRRHFFARWLKDPRHIGAVVPSGRSLARRMAAQVDPDRPGHVLELGPGTGVITRELLAAGVAPARLVLVERDPRFQPLLRERFPAVTLLNGDAAKLRDLLAAHDVSRLAAVVSGLPMLTLPEDVQRAVLSQSFELLGEDGVFVQFTYSPGLPVPRRRLESLGLNAERAGRAWRNIPPAHVWRFQRQSKEQR